MDSDVPQPERIHEPREAIRPPAGDLPADPLPDTRRPSPGGIDDPDHQEIVRVLEKRIDVLKEEFLKAIGALQASVQRVIDDGMAGHELRRSHEHLSARVQVLEDQQGNSGSLRP